MGRRPATCGAPPRGGPHHQPLAATPVLDDGGPRHRDTRSPVDPRAGRSRSWARYEESYAVATELHNVPLAELFAHRGRLAVGELRALEEAIRIAHGLVEAEL